MKKIIVFVLLLMPLAFVVNAQKSSTKKMQVIDRSYNPVRHWRIYVIVKEVEVAAITIPVML